MPNSSLDLSKLTKKETPVFSSMLTARIVWLRQPNRVDDKGQELYRRMQAQGLALTIVDAFDVTADELLSADLVLLDAFDSLEGSIEMVVARIRFESRVPLIMLTSGYSSEQLVTALTVGADGIWSLNTPVELLLARCNALLRRWLPPRR
jgi:DNA-binding response OmpR family regulator